MNDKFDKDYILQVLELLGHREAGGVTEVRIFPQEPYMIINSRREYVGATVSGYYDDYHKLSDDIAPFDGKVNIYVTFNPVIPDLLARANNRLQYHANTTTSDDDILCDLWFPIDCDPIRPTNISSTDAELQMALTRRNEVMAFLSPWAQGIQGLSGNGGHELIRLIGYPNDAETRDAKERLTKFLHDRFTDWKLDDDGNFVLDDKGRKMLRGNGVSVDSTVFNTARIWKLYGTMAVKGDNIPDRPHRRAQLDIPDTIPEPVDLYAHLNEIIPQESTQEQEPTHTKKKASNVKRAHLLPNGDYPLLDVEAYLNASGVAWRTKEKSDRTWFQFETCPIHTDDDGDKWECGICQDTKGAMGAKCMHEPSYTWTDFKEVLGDPKPYYVKEAKKGKKERVGISPGEKRVSDEMGTEPVPDEGEKETTPKDDKIRGDKRSQHLLFWAKQYHQQKMPRKEILVKLRSRNENRCEPVLTEAEITQVMDKAIPRIQPISAATLMEQNFPEQKWAIPEFVPEGLTILAGRPKVGKSWLALSFCAAIAMGGYAMGKVQVEQGEALFIGLEDNYRRLQDRLYQICEDERPSALQLLLDIPPLDQGGLAMLGDWLDEQNNMRLVVIDTLAKVRPEKLRRSDLYLEDYRFTGLLQEFAMQRNLALLVVHHTRKAEADYRLDELSGTTGISAGADAVLILRRTLDGNILYRNGREVVEGEFAVRRDNEAGGWELLGDAKEFAISEQRKLIVEVLKEADDTMSPQEISTALGKESGSVRFLLSAMVKDGTLIRPSRGKYQLSDFTTNNANNANNPSEAGIQLLANVSVSTNTPNKQQKRDGIVKTPIVSVVSADQKTTNNQGTSESASSEPIVSVVSDVSGVGNKQVEGTSKEIYGRLSNKLTEYLERCPVSFQKRLIRDLNADNILLSRATEAARRMSNWTGR